MAANISPIFLLTANCAEVTFVNADGTTAKDLVSAGSDGSKILAVNVCSDDTATVEMELYLHDGTTAYLLGTQDVATLSGTDGATAAINLLDSAFIPAVDADGELFIPSGYKLQVAPKAAVTATYTVTVVCFAGNY